MPHLLTMSPEALRATARRWYVEGFKTSGYGFHGEKADLDKQVSMKDLLVEEFERLWAQRNK